MFFELCKWDISEDSWEQQNVLPTWGQQFWTLLTSTIKTGHSNRGLDILTGHFNTLSPFLIQVSLHFCFGISNPVKDRDCKSKSYCHFIIILKKCLIFLYSFQFFFYSHKISKYLLLPLHAVLSCLQQNFILSAPCCILNDKVVQV